MTERFSVDTNILIYAVDYTQPAKKAQSRDLLSGLVLEETVLSQQVYGEFLSVGFRRRMEVRDVLFAQLESWQKVYTTLPTQVSDLTRAFDLATRYRLQYWDALILTVVRAAGVTLFFSEDMQDGLNIGTLKIRNPFAEHNRSVVEPFMLKRDHG